MGLKLVDLLRWKKEVTLKGEDGKPLEQDGKPVTVWIRLLGDQDLQDAYRASRIKSSIVRKALRDKDSDEYKELIEPLSDISREVCKTLITSAMQTDFQSQGSATIERPELPKIEEVAVDADAPTLEEQEKLDKLVDEVEAEYQAKLEEYVKDRTTEKLAEIELFDDENLRALALFELSNIRAMEAFIEELGDQKVSRAVYNDKLCKEKAFSNVAEYRDTASIIKAQLIAEYSSLELNPDDIKN